MSAFSRHAVQAVLLGGLAAASLPAFAQSAAQPGTAVPEKIEPNSTGSTSETLSRTDGVIRPPAEAGAGIVVRPPVADPGTTPVIRPEAPAPGATPTIPSR